MADLIPMLAAAAGAAAGGGETDPNFNQTVLLLHGDGTDGAQNNTFLDSSSNNFTITRNGNTTQGTFSPFSAPDGRWSNYFAGGGSRLTTGTISLAGDFCIEGWIYVTSASELYPMIVGGSGTTGSANHQFRVIESSGAIGLVIAGTQVIADSGTAVTLDAWHHVVACRSGTDCAVFVDGVRQGTGTSSGTFAAAWIGDRNAADYSFVGYMSNIRIVNGASVYDPTSSSLTVPTGPLSDITDTDLLTCSLNRFVDASAAGTTVTPTGTVTVTPFSPFAPTAAYSAATNGGSGYFDGSDTIYVSAAQTTPLIVATDDDFSIECWVYFNALATSYFVSWWDTSGNRFRFGVSGSNLELYDGATSITGALGRYANEWIFCAVSREAGAVKLFVNGQQVGTTVTGNTRSFNQTDQNYYIGSLAGSQNYVNGYIAGFRQIIGAAVDYASLGIPTAPPTDITNTSILCNFTNAGIFDNTGKNNLGTVGNAQIDTTTKKYGTGSMEFVRSPSSYLVAPNQYAQFSFGTGNFTVEAWVYLNTLPAGNGYPDSYWIVGGGPLNSNTGFDIAIGSTNLQVGLTNFASLNINYAHGMTTGTWYHIAVVRSGATLYAFKDGVQLTTASVSGVSADPMLTGLAVSAAEPSGSTSGNFNGFIDDLRITKGVARYTTTFTPPTKAFPDL